MGVTNHLLLGMILQVQDGLMFMHSKHHSCGVWHPAIPRSQAPTRPSNPSLLTYPSQVGKYGGIYGDPDSTEMIQKVWHDSTEFGGECRINFRTQMFFGVKWILQSGLKFEPQKTTKKQTWWLKFDAQTEGLGTQMREATKLVLRRRVRIEQKILSNRII